MAPEIKNKGQLSPVRFNVYDIAPTLYDFAGININKKLGLSMTGRSLRHALINRYQTDQDEQSYFIELHHMKAYVNKDNWKIRAIESDLNHVKKPSEWTLFNLNDDPLETKDLSSEYPDFKKQLIREYDDWIKLHGVIEARGKRLLYLGRDRHRNLLFGR